MYMECRHIKTNGLRCESPALKDAQFCYYHSKVHTVGAEPHLRYGPLQLPAPEDAAAIQLSVARINDAIINDRIILKKATAILYGLQIAAQFIDRKKHSHDAKSVQSVEQTSAGDELAPGIYICEGEDCNECPFSNPGQCTRWHYTATDTQSLDDANDEPDDESEDDDNDDDSGEEKDGSDVANGDENKATGEASDDDTGEGSDGDDGGEQLPDPTACGINYPDKQEVSAHDFTACRTTYQEKQGVSAHDFTACGTTYQEKQEVSGYDFSRAVSASKVPWALAPARPFPGEDVFSGATRESSEPHSPAQAASRGIFHRVDQPVDRSSLVFDLNPQRNGLDRKRCGQRAQTHEILLRRHHPCRTGLLRRQRHPLQIAGRVAMVVRESKPCRQAQAGRLQPAEKLLRTRNPAKRHHRPIDSRHLHAPPHAPHDSLEASGLHPFRNLGFVRRNGNDIRPLRRTLCLAQIARRQ